MLVSTKTDDARKTPTLIDCDDTLRPVQTYKGLLQCAVASVQGGHATYPAHVQNDYQNIMAQQLPVELLL